MNSFEVVIIGAGPAGIAAALQLNRMGIAPLLLEKNRPGGLLVNANLVENYPGLDHPLSGIGLAEIFQKQLAKTATRIVHSEVIELDYADDLFSVKTSDAVYRASRVLLASGTRARKIPELEIAPEANPKVFTEIYSLLNLSGRDIVIIGAGDAAFDYALNLSRKNRVRILNRSARRKCLTLLFERALTNKGVNYLENTKVMSVTLTAENKLSLEIQCADASGRLECDYLVTAVGREAELDYLSARLKSQMRILQDEGILYLAGDVKNGLYRQASIAAGEGVRTAMMIAEKLRGCVL